MSYVWFTSDHHWGHANIIRFSNRPFASVEEMDEALVERWNGVVQTGDTVYHLGDMFLYKDVAKARAIRERLKGNICLIEGNHESTALRMKERFAWVKEIADVKIPDPDAAGGEQRIVLCHYAFRVWNKSHHGAWHLYGHSHGSLADDPLARSFDAGVDCHDYAPISYRRVKELMGAKQYVPVDHHKGR
jgi:calcineurin-like phosphoesterase family protein